MARYFTSFGFAEADSQKSADAIAFERWREEGWAQGAYKPMARKEFDAAHDQLKKYYGIESDGD